jgi:uncharacterized protein
MSKPSPSRAKQAKRANSKSSPTGSAFGKAVVELRHSPGEFAPVSGRWILGALSILLVAAMFCAWGTLCLLYWQGSWQLLYHPKAEITRTPAAVGLPFEEVKFASTETGTNRLTGWWLPAENARFTLLYLHGANGNLSETADALAAFHATGLNVFAVDYRGYGLSQSAQPAENKPSEKKLRQDAEWALTWITLTRQIPAKTVIVAGNGLGANLAAELAADHSELAGVILDQPSTHTLDPLWNDGRSRLVPAHWIVDDRYDLFGPARRLKLPSLWLLPKLMSNNVGNIGNAAADNSVDLYGSVGPERSSQKQSSTTSDDAYHRTPGRKDVAWLTQPAAGDPHFAEILRRWLDDL